MRVRQFHSWDVTTTQAIDLQRRLANDVITTDGPTPSDAEKIQTVAGVDLSPPDPETGLVRGAAVILSFPNIEVVEVSIAQGTSTSGAPGVQTDGFDSPTLGNGAECSHTFTEAGTFAYFCRFHPSMTATITVEA